MMDLIISLNKPRDITSQKAVSAVKNLLKIKKAGHTGTLDPMATGLLLVCTGKATRLAGYFSAFDKDYSVVMKLGESTDTQDAYGNITNKVDSIDVDETSLKNVLKSFEGSITQTPPMFSALKHKGKPLYKYARKGIEIDRKERAVNISRIELLDFNSPLVKLDVSCTKGTYMRTLCDDIGNKLGVGAHLLELERTAIGSFSLSDSLSFEELRSVTPLKESSTGDPGVKGIYSMDSAMSWMPEFEVPDQLLGPVSHGNPIAIRTDMQISPELKTAAGIRIKSPEGILLAIGSFSAEKNIIKMDIVFC
jgi:tRNA pseudouridine55 synthase